MNYDKVITVEFDQRLVVGEDCVLELHNAWIGSPQDDLRTISGTRVVTIEENKPVDPAPSCGPGFPCEISGSFVAELCNRGVCPEASCPP